MATAIHVTTRVLPGRRVEIAAPELEEGANVDVFVVPIPVPPSEKPLSMLEFLETLPKTPGPRAFQTWEEYEAFLQREKDAWER